MSYKLRPRLGSAIASTILSVFSAVSLVGVDKAQAAVLSFNFHEETYGYNGFFKVDDSSLTRIGVEEVRVSEGIFLGFRLGPHLFTTNYPYYILTQRARAVFYQGAFRGLEAADANEGWRAKFYPSQLPAEFADYYGHYYGESSWYASWDSRARASWQITTRGPDDPSMWTSRISGYKEHREETYWINDRYPVRTPTKVDEYRDELNSSEVYYTLVDTEPSPVPEPLTAGGTALALAGLSWLKHKKKRAA
jgi:hypothetical protein